MVDMGDVAPRSPLQGSFAAPAAGSATDRQPLAPIGAPSAAESPCPQAHYSNSPHSVIMDIKEPAISVHCGITVDRLCMPQSCHGG